MNKKSAPDAALPSVYDEKCPLISALEIIGGKWKLPIIWFLSRSERVRFNELRRRVRGVTNMMLAKCLRELEEDGLVLRRQLEVIPPHVEYSLTERARSLVPILQKLYDWGRGIAPARQPAERHKTPFPSRQDDAGAGWR
ncbi:MAG: helix-turn-helix transcriptional regulator [Desulfovibrio sp.]|nr:helix-turn-helix transcriptional regulator [Desulfovibrio sp.]